MSHPVSARRRSGVLLPVTALPETPAHGDFDGAPRFIDWLSSAGFSVWQMLPLGPPHGDRSPYLCTSAHAGDPELIGLQWLSRQDFWGNAHVSGERQKDLQTAHQCFLNSSDKALRTEYQAFLTATDHWLTDYATFVVLRQHYGERAWTEWPQPLRDREQQALTQIAEQHAQAIDAIRFSQFLFFKQWREIKHCAAQEGVLLFGDMPLFVAHDSADVWVNRDYFKLDDAGCAEVVVGVPPDYFSATGQRWGNPNYRWSAIQTDRFQWWLQRMETQLVLYDLVRLDHFRGLQATWEIPSECDTAEHGTWREVPGAELLCCLQAEFTALPLVAEDLGLITPEVTALRKQFQLPGMAVLQFAFDGSPDNPYLPRNLDNFSVLYTGTHDNDTSLGWFQSLATEERERVMAHLQCGESEIPQALVTTALASIAQWTVIPLQDLLGLGRGHRINTPGTSTGNWRWRCHWQQLTYEIAAKLQALNSHYGR